MEKHKVWFIYVPLVLYWIVLLTLTTLPSQRLPSVNVSDKIEHLLAFTVLAIMLCFTYSFQRKYEMLRQKPFLFTFLTVVFYGALDELHQAIPALGRSCDIFDLMADTTGAVIGIGIVYLIKTFSRNTAPAE